MQTQKTHMTALLEALQAAGIDVTPDFKEGTVTLDSLPEFREKPAFRLTIVMDAPTATAFDSLFDGCALESGRMLRGAAHGSHLFSRKAAVERAKQEKWVASWILYDAGILPPEMKPLWESWQEVTLP